MLRAQLITLPHNTLLLPNTVVAEISHIGQVEKVPAMPEWIYGLIEWRGLSLPLVNVDGLLGQPIEALNDTWRLAVLNTLSNNPEMPFIAIASDSNPHLIKLLEEALDDELTEMHESHYIHAQYPLGKKTVLFPDINAIEESIQEALQL